MCEGRVVDQMRGYDRYCLIGVVMRMRSEEVAQGGVKPIGQTFLAECMTTPR